MREITPAFFPGWSDLSTLGLGRKLKVVTKGSVKGTSGAMVWECARSGAAGMAADGYQCGETVKHDYQGTELMKMY